MAQYSEFDWRLGRYRVYTHAGDGDGLFDPPAIQPGGDPRLGKNIDDALVRLPWGARFVGFSDVALGRVCIGPTSRSQARASLPSGVGGTEGAGGLGSIGDWWAGLSGTAKTLAVFGLAAVGGGLLALGAKGLVDRREARAARAANRRRRHGARRHNGEQRGLGLEETGFALLAQDDPLAGKKRLAREKAERERAEAELARKQRPLFGNGRRRRRNEAWPSSYHGTRAVHGETPRPGEHERGYYDGLDGRQAREDGSDYMRGFRQGRRERRAGVR